MTTETKKEGDFDPACVKNIRDDLDIHSLALKALGALLETSSLEGFAKEGIEMYPEPGDQDAANLRSGIYLLIDLYLDRQEEIVAKYCDQYDKSYLNIVRLAEESLIRIKQGNWYRQAEAKDILHRNIMNLDVVIKRDGELKEQAAALKEKCLQCLENLEKTKDISGLSKK